MKKKYVIELESGTHMFVFGPEGIVHIGEPDVVYETVDGMKICDAVINAKSYTEPDMEKIREEAFKNGYDAACKDIDIKSKTNAAYRKGLDDAWEAVKKLARMDTDTFPEVVELLKKMRWATDSKPKSKRQSKQIPGQMSLF